MARIDYQLVDVFTDRPFGGNPLAVCPETHGLDAATMQLVARELALSETTFVLPPNDPSCDWRVRIFTPRAELPMAGHPTIGTAWVLARSGAIEADRDRVVFEEGVGPVPVTIEWKDGAPTRCTMQQPRPQIGHGLSDRSGLAAMLSVDEEALVGPGVVVSCGVPYLVIELRSLAVTRAARLRLDVWERLLAGLETQQVLVFTRECETAGADAHMRMFAPGLGVAEDPATGSAAGPLGCHLVQSEGLGDRVFVFEQGFELDRPSFLHVAISAAAGVVESVAVGGDCVAMGRGSLEPGTG